MRKFTALLLAFAIMFCSFGFTMTAVAAEVNTISAVGGEGFPGDTVEFKVMIDNPLGFAGMTYEIEYDKDVLELVMAYEDEEEEDTYYYYESEIGAGKWTTSLDDDPATNPIVFTCGETKNVTGNGALAKLTFKIKDAAQPDTATTISVIPEDGSTFYYVGKTETEFTLTETSADIKILDKPEQDITVADSFEKTYGDAAFDIKVTKGSKSNKNGTVSFESADEDVVTVDSRGKVKIVGAGETTVTVSVPGNDTYKLFEKEVAIMVAPKAIEVVADDIEMGMGEEIPALTYKVTGLVNGDVLSGKLSTDANVNEPGRYDITLGTLGNDNYEIDFTAGTLTVEGPMLVLEDGEAVRESTVVYTVELKNNPGFAGLDFHIEYDNSIFEAVEYQTSLYSGMEIDEDKEEGITYFEFDSEENVDGDGELVTVVFEVLENAELGETEISVVMEEQAYYFDGNDKLEFNLGNVSATFNVIEGEEIDFDFEDDTVKYNGKPQTLEAEAVRTTPDNTEFTYEYYFDGEPVDEAVNVGIYTVEATAVCADGGWARTTKVATLKIEPANVTISNLVAVDKTYDGTTVAQIDKSAAKLTGVVEGDDVTPVIADTGVFESKDVSTKKITVDIAAVELAGEDAGNYVLVNPKPSLSAKISKASLTIVVEGFKVPLGTVIDASEIEYEVVGAFDDEYSFTGALKISGYKPNVAADYDIIWGNLKLATSTKNYVLDKDNSQLGVVTVYDKEDQEIEITGVVEELTYGDAGFKIDVIVGELATDSPVVFESTNTDVATIDGEGNVTVVGAGETVLKVTKEGDETYAEVDESFDLTVNKKPVTLTVESKQVKVGNPEVDLTYIFDLAQLVGDDTIEVVLTREEGNEVDDYAITADVTISDNYDLTIVPGVYSILDKFPQTITIADFDEVTYGDDVVINVVANPDAQSGLTAFKYASDNDAVATVDENTGAVTIVGAGTAKITVTEPGDNNYAAGTDTKDLVVAAKELTVLSVDVENGVVEIEGVINDDDVAVDYSKVRYEVESVEGDLATLKATNFVLTGDKVANYTIDAEKEIPVENVDVALLATVSFGEVKNGTLEGNGTYFIGSEVTVKAVPNKNYKFDGWYEGAVKIQEAEAEYTFTIEGDIALTAKFKKTGGGGGGGGTSKNTVYLEVSTGVINKVVVSAGEKLQNIDEPVREGYKFLGWYTDKELTKEYSFDKVVRDSFTLYAKWEAVEEPEQGEDDKEEPKEDEWKNPYSDVKAEDWFYDAVKYANENNIFKGVTETTFNPNGLLTRAMLVTVLYRVEGEPEVEEAANFDDVDFDAWYGKAVAWANANGIVTGNSADEFAPENNITREQIATIVHRYALYKEYDVSVGENTNILSYDDVADVSEYAIGAVQYAVGSGLIKGRTNTTINPKDTATRAEAATIIKRLLENLSK